MNKRPRLALLSRVRERGQTRQARGRVDLGGCDLAGFEVMRACVSMCSGEIDVRSCHGEQLTDEFGSSAGFARALPPSPKNPAVAHYHAIQTLKQYNRTAIPSFKRRGRESCTAVNLPSSLRRYRPGNLPDPRPPFKAPPRRCHDAALRTRLRRETPLVARTLFPS